METLIWLCVVLIVLGVVFYLITAYVLPALPIPEPFRLAIVAILALIVILWLVSNFLGVGPPAAAWRH